MSERDDRWAQLRLSNGTFPYPFEVKWKRLLWVFLLVLNIGGALVAWL